MHRFSSASLILCLSGQRVSTLPRSTWDSFAAVAVPAMWRCRQAAYTVSATSLRNRIEPPVETRSGLGSCFIIIRSVVADSDQASDQLEAQTRPIGAQNGQHQRCGLT